MGLSRGWSPVRVAAGHVRASDLIRYCGIRSCACCGRSHPSGGGNGWTRGAGVTLCWRHRLSIRRRGGENCRTAPAMSASDVFRIWCPPSNQPNADLLRCCCTEGLYKGAFDRNRRSLRALLRSADSDPPSVSSPTGFAAAPAITDGGFFRALRNSVGSPKSRTPSMSFTMKPAATPQPSPA
jgi:hypothetical protein